MDLIYADRIIRLYTVILIVKRPYRASMVLMAAVMLP